MNQGGALVPLKHSRQAGREVGREGGRKGGREGGKWRALGRNNTLSMQYRTLDIAV